MQRDRLRFVGKRENQVGGSPGDRHGGEGIGGVDRGRHRGSGLHAARRWKTALLSGDGENRELRRHRRLLSDSGRIGA